MIELYELLERILSMTNSKKMQLITVFCLSVALTACEEKVQTIDWYKTHAKEREEVIAKCNNNPGELGNKPNCINARIAS